jgi:hypothetical protein
VQVQVQVQSLEQQCIRFGGLFMVWSQTEQTVELTQQKPCGWFGWVTTHSFKPSNPSSTFSST